MLHHSSWARQKLQEFCGREELVEQVMVHVYPVEGQRSPKSAVHASSLFAGLDLSIIGVSGTRTGDTSHPHIEIHVVTDRLTYVC